MFLNNYYKKLFINIDQNKQNISTKCLFAKNQTEKLTETKYQQIKSKLPPLGNYCENSISQIFSIIRVNTKIRRMHFFSI